MSNLLDVAGKLAPLNSLCGCGGARLIGRVGLGYLPVYDRRERVAQAQLDELCGSERVRRARRGFAHVEAELVCRNSP